MTTHKSSFMAIWELSHCRPDSQFFIVLGKIRAIFLPNNPTVMFYMEIKVE